MVIAGTNLEDVPFPLFTVPKTQTEAEDVDQSCKSEVCRMFHVTCFSLSYIHISSATFKNVASSMGVTGFLWLADNLYVNFRSPYIIFAGAKLKFQTSNAIKRHEIIGSLDHDVRKGICVEGKGDNEHCPARPPSLMQPVNYFAMMI